MPVSRAPLLYASECTLVGLTTIVIAGRFYSRSVGYDDWFILFAYVSLRAIFPVTITSVFMY